MRLAAAALAALVLAASAGGASQKTRVTIYRPYVGGKISSTLKVTRTAKGSCFSGASADPRSDAWRCFIGANAIADPCFAASAAAHFVVCPADGTPFGSSVVRVDLSKPLARSFANKGVPGEGNPWGIKLADGKICTFLTGATFVYHRQRVNYGCTRTIFLAGSPDRSKATWTIELGTDPKSKPRTAAIAVAAW